MAINFPNSPTNGQIFTSGGRSYEYNSAAGVWNRREQTAATIPSDISDLTDTTNVIPDDISDLTDTGGVLGTGGATVYADMAALIAATGMSNGDFGLVAANNNIYVYNGAGWYKIATVQNDSPSAITGVAGTYELAIDGTATTITAVSTDPEGFPLTWSYSASGLGNIATVSNTDNVFTITPSTTEADAGTFTLTINATDGVNGAVSTSTNLTLEFIVTITNSNYTTLLATAVDTSDNNNITDSSTNNHTPTLINPTNALTQGSFSPYRSGGYSSYFDGTGDYLATTSSNYALGTSGAFTLELWYYLEDARTHTLFDSYPSGYVSGNGEAKLAIISGGSGGSGDAIYLYGGAEVGNLLAVSRTFSVGVWEHFCWTRDTSGNHTFYINGTQIGTSTATPDIDINLLEFGRRGGSFNSTFMKGYLSDVRLVKGTAITPPSGGPTERLEAVTNTSLLTCHLPYIADGSTNYHSITVNGDVSTKPFSPYDYLEYSVADYGGSIESTNFDNTSAGRTGLNFADHADFDLAGSDWTFEWWAYVPKAEGVNNHNFINKGPLGAIRPYSFNYRLESGQPGWEPRMFGSSDGSSQWQGYSGAAWQPWSTWTHVAFVRNGSTITRYINGKAYGTGSGDVFDNNELLYVGGGYGDEQPHTYSDLRISKSAVYTAEFTPPTAPLSSSGASLHLKGTDASIIDKSQGSNLKLIGNTTGSTTQVKFADTKSMYFDGTGVGLSTSSPALDGEFTIECWVYFNSFSGGTFQTLFSQAQAVGGPAEISTRNNNNTIQVLFDAVSTANKVTADWTTSINTWYHLAIVRDSNNAVAIYVDGSALSNVTNSTQTLTLFGHTADLYIGQYDIYNSYPFDGYMQDVRITKGLARYTANFTPPTASLEG